MGPITEVLNPRETPPLLVPTIWRRLIKPQLSGPEGKVQPLREAGLRQTAENQVPQSRSNPKGLLGCAFCSLPLRYELRSRDPGEHLAKNEHRTHKTVTRGPPGNSPQLSWEQLDVSSRRWSVAISVLCSLTKWSVNSLLCGNVQTIAWENARVTPFLPRQFSLEEPLKCEVSDAYKHPLKCSSLRG